MINVSEGQQEAFVEKGPSCLLQYVTYCMNVLKLAGFYFAHCPNTMF